MNLGQSMLVIAAMALLGFLALSANSSVMDSTQTSDNSEFGVTAVSLATSIIQEAMSKMFDEVTVDSGAVTDPSQLTPSPFWMHRDPGEHYRGGVNDFDDISDFDSMLFVYTSPLDPAPEPGADTTIIVPGIRDRYFVRTRVQYVDPNNLDQVVAGPTWHKRIVVTVTSSSPRRDTIAIPAVMSYW